MFVTCVSEKAYCVADCTISFHYDTEFDHMKLNVGQTFKVKG